MNREMSGWFCLWMSVSVLWVPAGLMANELPPVNERFAETTLDETPSFQRHVVPLFGQLGCNARACHGAFHGQGGFHLSLFGYDFQTDLDALADPARPRIDLKEPDESLILAKPTDEYFHEGGQRYEEDSWQYHLFLRWIQAGAPFDSSRIDHLTRLEVTPAEIVFDDFGQSQSLRAVAVWADGTREDVTPLTRFTSNDDQIADVSPDGVVTSGEKGDTHVIVSYDKAVVAVPVLRPVTELTGADYPDVPAPTKIDQLVVKKLRTLGIVPSELCSDEDFLRRVSLDMTGTLPTAEEVVAFVEDPSPDKRARKIDQLLDSPAYAAWWTTKLCDFTGNNEFQLRNALPAVGQRRNVASQIWYDWIYQRVAENVPYDQIVEGIVTATSRSEGQSYREYCEQMAAIYRGEGEKGFADLPSMPYYWARTELRQPDARTISFAHAFLGVRLECAQCHKHPFDQWSKEDFELFTNFFRPLRYNNGPPPDRQARRDYDQIVSTLDVQGARGNQLRQQFGRLLMEGETVPFPELIVQNNAPRGRFARRPDRSATLLGGETVHLADYDDVRQPLMQWLRSEDNPYFARAFVNRVWASYFNVGIVHPPDDMSLGNPPSNQALLDYLADGFVESGFDMKWVHREIANSRTYQLSWQPNETNRWDERNFSRAVPRRLPAEVVVDAVQQATASDQRAVRMRDELNGRAIAMAGVGNRNANRGPNYALSVFGRSTRETNCDCDRSDEVNLLQTVFLQNDREVLALLDANNSWIGQLRRQWNRPGGRQAARPAAEAVPQRVAEARQRLRRLRQQGRTAEAQRLQRQIAQMQRQLQPRAAESRRDVDGSRQRAEEAQRRTAGPVSSEPQPTLDRKEMETLVTQAYLRALSRYPNEDELQRSVSYVQEADEPLDGVRDVLWALINTKEFLVNH